MNPSALPDRFAAILSLLRPEETLADIGFDHGDFLVRAVSVGHRVIGVERQAACLSRFFLRHSKLTDDERDRIQLRCGDGPSELREADQISTATIAGLGEQTIVSWAKRLPSNVQKVVACPSDMRGTLRVDMRKAGFRIVDERIAAAKGRLYPVIAWEKGTECRDIDFRYLVGPVLFEAHPAALRAWLTSRLDRLASAINRLEQKGAPTDATGVAFHQWVNALQQANAALQSDA